MLLLLLQLLQILFEPMCLLLLRLFFLLPLPRSGCRRNTVRAARCAVNAFFSTDAEEARRREGMVNELLITHRRRRKVG